MLGRAAQRRMEALVFLGWALLGIGGCGHSSATLSLGTSLSLTLPDHKQSNSHHTVSGCPVQALSTP